MTDKSHITIFTDGGAKPNPGPGGWGALLLANNAYTKELSGADPETTNNRMELTAAVEALRALNQPSRVTLHTDSQYLKNGITRWLYSWIKNDWMTSQDTPVQNQDLWQALHTEIQRHDITWEWVRGHAGNTYNERVDQLATQARQAITGEAPRPADSTPQSIPVEIEAEVELAIRVSAPKGQSGGGWAIRIASTAPESGTGTAHTGYEANATSNQLVLIAAANALRRLPAGAAARFYCPDDYLYKGMTEWIKNWQKAGWRTSGKKPVQNRELWQALLKEASSRSVQWMLESRQEKLPLARGLEKLAADAATASP